MKLIACITFVSIVAIGLFVSCVLIWAATLDVLVAMGLIKGPS